MTPSNYQRTRWLTLIGTIITQFALGSVYTWLIPPVYAIYEKKARTFVRALL